MAEVPSIVTETLTPRERGTANREKEKEPKMLVLFTLPIKPGYFHLDE